MVEDIIRVIREIFAQIAAETVRLIPKIFIVLVVIVLTALVIKLLNFSFRKLLKMVRLDEAFERLAGITLPFSLSNVIIWVADLGIALIAIYGIVNLFLGTLYTQLFTEGLYYGARVLSIIALTLVIFTLFNTAIEKVKVETRLKGYMFFIILLLVTAMLVDITALSDPVKNALITGLSLGVLSLIHI